MIQDAIHKLVAGKDLTEDEVSECVAEIVDGEATQAQVGGFLVALRQKGETVDEIASLAMTLRRRSVRISPSVPGRLVDTCGTGGDGARTFNVSTVSALVAAGGGAYVAKHGNRSVTSKCGSADLLERLGFRISMEPDKVRESIERVGIGFMFAPSFHPAMKAVARVRKESGIRTVFNLIGPLINPAGAESQVVGVYSPELVEKAAEALVKLGTTEAMVVHANEGLDEISVSGRTLVSRVRKGKMETREYTPSEFGVPVTEGASLEVADVEEAAEVALDVLSGRNKDKAASRMVVANSAAALLVAGKASTLEECAELARQSLESGKALEKLEALVSFSGGDASRIEIHA